MNQLEAPADCTWTQDGGCHLATAAESMKDAPERPAASSSNNGDSVPSPQFKRFPPPPPLDLSETRILRLSSSLQSVERNKHENPEIDQDDDHEQANERMDDCNQGDLDDLLDDGYHVSARRESVTCELMVNYDGFESVGKPFRPATSGGLPHLAFGDDGEDDVVNFHSPIIYKPSSAKSETLSPTCVSALARGENDTTDKLDEPSWSIREFQQYLDMLDMLQEVYGSSQGEDISLSADSLGQMERLLTSLLPPGMQL